MDFLGRGEEDIEQDMFNPFRRRPHAYFERTPSGRERIILGRRHSHNGYREPDDSREDIGRGLDQQRRLLGENEALRLDNQRLLRDNQALTRQLNALAHERDYLAQQNQRNDESGRVIGDLEHRLNRERRRLRDERAEREALDIERVGRARETAGEIRRLREEDRRWRTVVMELTREVENWVRVNRDKERRIRDLEAWLRRLGYGGVR